MTVTPQPHLLRGLAAHMGSALAFADDRSERQLRTVGSAATSATLNAVARSYMIGALRDAPIAKYRLAERHTDLNKVVMVHVDSKTRFWLKSETAVRFTFAQGEPLFTYPSGIHVLTFTVLLSEVEFQHAPISRLKSKRYKLESPLVPLGRYPLGGSVPPGGYPSSRTDSIFDAGPDDDYDDLFDEEGHEGTGEESA